MALRTLLSEQQIQSRILELGARIEEDYPEGPLLLIGILKGAFYFLGDLSRAISRDVFIDFMGISSYGRGKSSSGDASAPSSIKVRCSGSRFCSRAFPYNKML